MLVHILNIDILYVTPDRSKLKALQNKDRGARSEDDNEDDNEEFETLPGTLVVINQAIVDITAKLGHPEFQNVTGASSRCSFFYYF